MNRYDYIFPIMFVAAFAAVVFNISLVIRLRESHNEIFKELGSPSAFYFAGVQWMFNSKVFTWLWSSAHKLLADNGLSKKIYWLRICWITFHLSFLLLIFRAMLK